MDLALFNFDGTITTKGTYPGFVRFAVPRRRQLIGGVVLAPALIGYHARLVSDATIRRLISRVGLWRADQQRVRSLGERYATDVLPPLVRPEALERIAWHKARGDRVVVVSASLDAYLEPWCRALDVDVICTRLEADKGRLTGAYASGDCCGEEKVRRIRSRYNLADYDHTYAYGDTEEDRGMLELADRKYFRWNPVADVPAVSYATRRGDGGI
jgi:HAD superfamily hydrolase (TIGR01490 family)